MENIYLILVVVLFALAISDLIVGVSNDAVNFLNSAIGSRAAKKWVIFLVASLGVLVGSTFSSGMMEVARKGIFNPQMFVFSEIIVIFLAVMITDVILLDLFNTFGFPTSTTVSIVFELLGSAVAVAVVKVGEAGGMIGDYINSDRALLIIIGILLSVVIAFSGGALIQWLTRVLFSFKYDKRFRYFGSIYGGLAITAIMYFILIKGLKGSVYADHAFGSISLVDWADFLARTNYDGFKSLVKSLGKSNVPQLAEWAGNLKAFDKETYKTGAEQFVVWVKSSGMESTEITLKLLNWVKYYTLHILGIGFVGFSVILAILTRVFKFNILKFIVLVGTFALAMAFASNDLVNFIGVPLAGFESFKLWTASGLGAGEFTMESLAGKVETPTYMLVIAGFVMIAALIFSKKARSVVKTSLDLSRQSEGDERFGSSGIARVVVKTGVAFSEFTKKFVPASVQRSISKQFVQPPVDESIAVEERPEFDKIRAASNLIVASILIAIGTSLKLPLSTTYVTFMVAMGTSLADQAWGRESAVYRISGVFAVIGGWFLTAMVAFTVSFIVARVMLWGGFVAIIIFALIAILVVIRTQFIFKKRSVAAAAADEEEEEVDLYENTAKVLNKCQKNTVSAILSASKAYFLCFEGFFDGNRSQLKKAHNEAIQFTDKSKYRKSNVYKSIRKLEEDSVDTGHFYVMVVGYLREMAHSIYYVVHPVYQHFENKHKPFNEEQVSSLREFGVKLNDFFNFTLHLLKEEQFDNIDEMLERRLALLDELKSLERKQIKAMKNSKVSTRNSMLYFSIINETKNLLLNLVNVVKSQRDFIMETRSEE